MQPHDNLKLINHLLENNFTENYIVSLISSSYIGHIRCLAASRYQQATQQPKLHVHPLLYHNVEFSLLDMSVLWCSTWCVSFGPFRDVGDM